jgi:hypothetical protein
MAISELQIALIGAGALAVGMVWGYNAWQDRKHRGAAERIFKGGQDDALLDGQQAAIPAAPSFGEDLRHEPAERQEPRFTDAADDAELPAGSEDAATTGVADNPPTETKPESEPQPAALPIEYADSMVDCVLRLTATAPVPAPAVWAMQNAWVGELSKPLHWLVRNDVDGVWRQIDAHDTGRYREWVVALQLADRRGPVSDGELARFFDGVQQVAKQSDAELELPSRSVTVLRADRLDQFCASVDIQFVLHVVEALGGVFPGTKLRGVAEAAGLALEADGVFRARDEAGGELFTVANLGAERLDAESIKSLATHGLTLSLDVPRVTDGALAFDRMLATARQLAATLGGELVDAQRVPLSVAMIDAIRARTAELQKTMRDGGIDPGGIRAQRLFS